MSSRSVTCWRWSPSSWLISLLPLLAYTSLAILFSVASRNGIVGVLGPILVALLTQLLALIGNGVWVHLLLIGSAFDAWHGLFVGHPFFGPLVVSLLVCLAWIAGSARRRPGSSCAGASSPPPTPRSARRLAGAGCGSSPAPSLWSRSWPGDEPRARPG